MAWAAKYTQTTGVNRTGTVTAVFTDAIDPTDKFTYEEVRLAESGGLAGFVSRAQAALAAYQTARAAAATIAARITNALNA